MSDASASASAHAGGLARLAALAETPRVQVGLASLVLAFGVAVACSNLDRGVWQDEFATLCKTARDVSPAAFARYLATEQHPLGYYGFVYVARRLGLEGVVALRALNLLGVPLVLLALRRARRRGVLDPAQTCLVVALYASAPIFFAFVPELRAYFLAYSTSIAVTSAWLALLAGGPARGDLLVFGALLALYCSLHYFALPLAALLTLAAILAQLRRRAWASALKIALAGVLAAAPALALWQVQARVTLAAGKMAHLDAASGSVLRPLAAIARDAAGRNGVVYLLALLALIAIVRGRPAAAQRVAALVLGVVVLATYGGLALGALIAPILAERYLVVPAGAITVLAAVLAMGRGAPRFGLALACLVALALQVRVLVRAPYREAHWRTSAEAVADEVRKCPTTRVLAAVLVDHTRDVDESAAVWRTGYRYYARELGFAIEELWRGDVVGASGPCPTVIWMEHAWKTAAAPLPEVLRELEVTVTGTAERRHVGSGMLVLVR